MSTNFCFRCGEDVETVFDEVAIDRSGENTELHEYCTVCEFDFTEYEKENHE
jgi:hypothetical protein